MDGENNGKPCEQMDDFFGENVPLFSETSIFAMEQTHDASMGIGIFTYT